MAAIDITGQRFGRVTVTRRIKGSNWLCQCDCGNEKVIYGGNLKSGRSQSCGCLHREVARNQYVDHTGERFGRLVAMEKAESCRNGHTRWICLCDCGRTKAIASYHLVAGLTSSCGCLQIEQSTQRFTTHGMSGTARFDMFHAAKSRSKSRGIPFNLTLSDIPDTPELCPLLGVRLKHGVGKSEEGSPTLDRIIPALGYIKDNVQVISRRANVIKNDASFDEFERIYKNWKAKISV